MTKPKEIYSAYDSGHLSEIRSQAARGAAIVCLDFWLERELRKNDIPCVPLRDFVEEEVETGAWWVLDQDIAREWYRLPAMRFFEHDDIRIAEALEPSATIGLVPLIDEVEVLGLPAAKVISQEQAVVRPATEAFR